MPRDGPRTIKMAINDWNIAMPCCIFSGWICCLNSFITDGCENCDRIAEMKVAK
ncbi:hypothetical protein D1872_228790 [compost metagenome]